MINRCADRSMLPSMLAEEPEVKITRIVGQRLSATRAKSTPSSRAKRRMDGEACAARPLAEAGAGCGAHGGLWSPDLRKDEPSLRMAIMVKF